MCVFRNSMDTTFHWKCSCDPSLVFSSEGAEHVGAQSKHDNFFLCIQNMTIKIKLEFDPRFKKRGINFLLKFYKFFNYKTFLIIRLCVFYI